MEKYTIEKLIKIEDGLLHFTEPDGGFKKLPVVLSFKFRKIIRLIEAPLKEYREAEQKLVEDKGVFAFEILSDEQKDKATKEFLESAKTQKVLANTEENQADLKELLNIEYELDLPTIPQSDFEKVDESIHPYFIELLEPLIDFN